MSELGTMRVWSLGPADALTLDLTLYRRFLIDVELDKLSANVSIHRSSTAGTLDEC